MESNIPLFIAREVKDIENKESFLNKVAILENILLVKELEDGRKLNRN
jgi:hypothetical protein